MLQNDFNIIEEFISSLDFKGNETLDEMLGYVLAKTRRIVGAEAGTIFIAEPLLGESKSLRCVALQNDTVEISTESFTVPIDPSSIAGYAATTGELVRIDDLYNINNKPYKFNQTFDRKYRYKSVSMLAVPLRNIRNEVVGVIQLLNHLSDTGVGYIPFQTKDVTNMKSLSLIMGMLVEHTALMEEINRLKQH